MLTANGDNKPLPIFDLSKPLVEVEAWPPAPIIAVEPTATVVPEQHNEPLIPSVPTKAICHKCKNTLSITEFITCHGSVKNRCRSCRKSDRRRQTVWQRKTRLRTADVKFNLLNQMGCLSCIRCGYEEFISALEFHHRNPKQKDSQISQLISRYATTPTESNMERLLAEAGKCDVLCSNCHQALHAKDW